MSRLQCAVILPSRNEEATIASVTETVDGALQDVETTIINVDASADDQTRNAFVGTRTKARKMSLRVSRPGKGLQVWAGIRALPDIPDALLVFDTDNRAPNPIIFRALFDQIASGADFASANYRRHWFEGNLTNHVARPLVLANTGVDVAQPIPGEMALSHSQVCCSLKRRSADYSVEFVHAIDGYGIDAFLLLTCLSSKLRFSAIDTNEVKLHAPSFPHLPQIFREALPVLCAPEFRLHHQNCSWSGRFELNAAGTSPDIQRMLVTIDTLGSAEAREPFPTKLFRVWSTCTTEHIALAAVGDLWEDYLNCVRQYLQVGREKGVDGAVTLLANNMESFLGELAQFLQPR